METISTSSREKLPKSVRGLVDDACPLPPGVTFYEERFTSGTVVKNAIWGVALLAAGMLFMPLGVYELFASRKNVTVSDNHSVEWWIIGFGFVLAIFGWSMVASVPVCLAVRRRQLAGQRTRYGLFLTPEALVFQNHSDTTVIPPENLRGLEGLKLNYEGGARPGVKSFTLPQEWVNVTWPDVERAIRAWSPPLPPPEPPKAPAASVDPSNKIG